MTTLENILMFAGISMDVFAAMEIQGSMIARVNKKTLSIVVLITIALQLLFFNVGYWPCFVLLRNRLSEKSTVLGLGIAAVVFIALGVRLLYKAIKRDTVYEHRCELGVKDYTKIIAVTTLYTLFAGCASGLIGTNFFAMVGIIILFSFVVVVIGLYLGLHFGFAGKTPIYAVGSALLLICGIEIMTKVL